MYIRAQQLNRPPLVAYLQLPEFLLRMADISWIDDASIETGLIEFAKRLGDLGIVRSGVAASDVQYEANAQMQMATSNCIVSLTQCQSGI